MTVSTSCQDRILTLLILKCSVAFEGLLYQRRLINSNRGVDVSHEESRGVESERTESQRERVRHESHVSKEERGLHEPMHIGTMEVKVELVQEHEESG